MNKGLGTMNVTGSSNEETVTRLVSIYIYNLYINIYLNIFRINIWEKKAYIKFCFIYYIIIEDTIQALFIANHLILHLSEYE